MRTQGDAFRVGGPGTKAEAGVKARKPAGVGGRGSISKQPALGRLHGVGWGGGVNRASLPTEMEGEQVGAHR